MVKVVRTKYNLFLVFSRVPQGSHFSPLIFSVFNSNVYCVLCNFCIFSVDADDVKLNINVRVQPLDDFLNLQYLLDLFIECLRVLNLNLDLSKFKIITFS